MVAEDEYWSRKAHVQHSGAQTMGDGMRISFILATIGRPTLRSVLRCLKDQVGAEDEVLVVNEGPGSETAIMVSELVDPRFITWNERKSDRPKGNGIRDAIIRRARGDFLFFIDDDDLIPEGAVETVRSAIAAVPDKPHLFAMRDRGGSERRRNLGMCDVGGPQFVPPNNPEKLGRWHNMNATAADWIFIHDTLKYYEHDELQYHDEIIYLVGQACIEPPQN